MVPSRVAAAMDSAGLPVENGSDFLQCDAFGLGQVAGDERDRHDQRARRSNVGVGSHPTRFSDYWMVIGPPGGQTPIR
jgi:hypothetical protein